MSFLHSSEGALFLIHILVSLFLAILFLQSGIDKVIDRGGNIEWLTGHFAKTPLRGAVPLLVTAITILEVAAGILCGVGAIMIMVSWDVTFSFFGSILAAISIVALFFGQRLAKDYAGAAVLVPYFFLTLGAIYLFA